MLVSEPHRSRGPPEVRQILRLLRRRSSPYERPCADAGRQSRPSLIQQQHPAPAPTNLQLTDHAANEGISILLRLMAWESVRNRSHGQIP